MAKKKFIKPSIKKVHGPAHSFNDIKINMTPFTPNYKYIKENKKFANEMVKSLNYNTKSIINNIIEEVIKKNKEEDARFKKYRSRLVYEKTPDYPNILAKNALNTKSNTSTILNNILKKIINENKLKQKPTPLKQYHSLIESNISGLYQFDITPGYLKIGDITFSVPPTNISITKSKNDNMFKTLRTRSSMKIPTGNLDYNITVQLYFPNIESLNGTTSLVTEQVGKKSYEYKFIRNGLRALIAQFRRIPFVEVKNEYIARNLNGEGGSLLVALEAISISSVPGFPYSFRASVSMRVVNSQVVAAPGETLKYMKSDVDSFVQEIHTFNASKPEYVKRKDVAYLVEKLKKLDTTKNHDGLIKKYGASVIENLEAISNKLDKKYNEQIPSRVISSPGIPYIRYYNGLLEELSKQGFGPYKTKEEHVLKKIDTKCTNNIELIPLNRNYRREYYEDMIFMLNKIKNSPYDLTNDTEFNDLRDKLRKKQIMLNDMYNFDSFGDKKLNEIARETLETYYTRSLDGKWDNKNKLIDTVETDISNKINYFTKILNTGLFERWSPDTKNAIYVKNNKLTNIKVIKKTNNKKPNPTVSAEYIPINSNKDVIITSVAASTQNELVTIPLFGRTIPTCQHIGSMDTIFNINIETNDPVFLERLNQADFSIDQKVSKGRDNWKKAGFFNIKNSFTSFNGIQYVTINNIQIDTIQGRPGWSSVSLTLIEIDPFAYRREKLYEENIITRKAHNEWIKQVLPKIINDKHPILYKMILMSLWNNNNTEIHNIGIRLQNKRILKNLKMEKFLTGTFLYIPKKNIILFGIEKTGAELNVFNFYDIINYLLNNYIKFYSNETINIVKKYRAKAKNPVADLYPDLDLFTLPQLGIAYSPTFYLASKYFNETVEKSVLSTQSDKDIKNVVKGLEEHVRFSIPMLRNFTMNDRDLISKFVLQQKAEFAYYTGTKKSKKISNKILVDGINRLIKSFKLKKQQLVDQIKKNKTSLSVVSRLNSTWKNESKSVGAVFDEITKTLEKLRDNPTITATDIQQNLKDINDKIKDNMNVQIGSSGISNIINDMSKSMQQNKMKDNFLSLNSSFPTFKIFFIEKDNSGFINSYVYRKFDDFYSYSSVISIDVIQSRKNPIDTCIMQLSNLSGNLTDISADQIGEDLLQDQSPYEQSVSKIMMKPGLHIEVRMGYGSNQDSLPIVFKGKIMEVNYGDIISVTAQSYGTELENNVVNKFTEFEGQDPITILPKFILQTATDNFGKDQLSFAMGWLSQTIKGIADDYTKLHPPVSYIYNNYVRQKVSKVANIFGDIRSEKMENVYFGSIDFEDNLYGSGGFLGWWTAEFHVYPQGLNAFLSDFVRYYPGLLYRIVPNDVGNSIFMGNESNWYRQYRERYAIEALEWEREHKPKNKTNEIISYDVMGNQFKSSKLSSNLDYSFINNTNNKKQQQQLKTIVNNFRLKYFKTYSGILYFVIPPDEIDPSFNIEYDSSFIQTIKDDMKKGDKGYALLNAVWDGATKSTWEKIKHSIPSFSFHKKTGIKISKWKVNNEKGNIDIYMGIIFKGGIGIPLSGYGSISSGLFTDIFKLMGFKKFNEKISLLPINIIASSIENSDIHSKVYNNVLSILSHKMLEYLDYGDNLLSIVTKIKTNKKTDHHPQFRPFTQYWIANHTNLVRNDIQINEAGVYNVMTATYTNDPGKWTFLGATLPGIGDQADTINNAPDSETIKYNNTINQDNQRTQTVFAMNALNPTTAKRYAQSVMGESLKDTYTGSLVILGNPHIRPYDSVSVFDPYLGMYGTVGVEQVVHSFSKESGMISTITPDLKTQVNDIYSTYRDHLITEIKNAAFWVATCDSLSVMLHSVPSAWVQGAAFILDGASLANSSRLDGAKEALAKNREETKNKRQEKQEENINKILNMKSIKDLNEKNYNTLKDELIKGTMAVNGNFRITDIQTYDYPDQSNANIIIYKNKQFKIIADENNVISKLSIDNHNLNTLTKSNPAKRSFTFDRKLIDISDDIVTKIAKDYSRYGQITSLSITGVNVLRGLIVFNDIRRGVTPTPIIYNALKGLDAFIKKYGRKILENPTLVRSLGKVGYGVTKFISKMLILAAPLIIVKSVLDLGETIGKLYANNDEINPITISPIIKINNIDKSKKLLLNNLLSQTVRDQSLQNQVADYIGKIRSKVSRIGNVIPNLKSQISKNLNKKTAKKVLKSGG